MVNMKIGERRNKNKQKPIANKLTYFAIIIIVLQTLFISLSLFMGGVLKESKNKALETFNEKVTSRRGYLEREMKNRWTNLNPFVSQISNIISEDYENNESLLSNVSELMIDMLRGTQTTGAFLILAEDLKEDKFDSIYLRDYDPITNSYTNNDIYMIMGPPDIARNLKIPLDQTWKYEFELTNRNEDFFLKPYNQASLSFDSNLLGYWSKPFQVSDNDLEVITYSMPIFDLDNELRGVIGIEITVNYLVKLLPATDIQPKDSLGYMITNMEASGSYIQPIVSIGALQKRAIDIKEPLRIKMFNSDLNTYILESHNMSDRLYANMSKIGLYKHNTPFEEESWYLIAFMREHDLFSYAEKIQTILWLAFIGSLVLGVIGSRLFSIWFSKPIVQLAKKVRNSDNDQKIHLDSTGLKEVDQLARAMENAKNEKIESASRLTRIIDMLEVPIGAFEIKNDNEMVFVTEKFFSIMGISESVWEITRSKHVFKALLDSVFSSQEADENGVYKIKDEPQKWVRINVTESENTIIGVVQDVTEEMLEKLQIMRDRDLDPLTKLYNRKAFQYYFEGKYLKEDLGIAAMIMFDLDNLKILNDTYGHKWGDTYIVEAVNHMKTLGNDSNLLLGRRSGDEFVAMLYGYESKKALKDTLNNFYMNLESSPISLPNGKEGVVSMSGGLIWLEYPEWSYDELLNYADETLYEAKRLSKGCWKIYGE